METVSCNPNNYLKRKHIELYYFVLFLSSISNIDCIMIEFIMLNLRYWLFGERVPVELNQQIPKEKGWFPRKCAMEVAGNLKVEKKQQ